MTIAWLGELQTIVDLGALIARKRNGQAAEALRARFEEQPPTVDMRLRYAHLLVRADRGREAIPMLLGLADELLADGFIERAIGALRTVLGIDPHADVKDRLRALSSQIQRRPCRDGFRHEDETNPQAGDSGYRRWSPRMRLRLAGLVHAAGDHEVAKAILLSLADDLAEVGLSAKALAIVEGVQRQRTAEPPLAEGLFEAWLDALFREPWATEEPLVPAES